MKIEFTQENWKELCTFAPEPTRIMTISSHVNPLHTRVGILGGGQLGKMLALAAGNWHLPIYALDEAQHFPAAPYCTGFVEGSFRRADDVYAFGKQVEVLTIEIEHVAVEALFQLEAEGVAVHPRPAALAIIKDKGLQKQFWQEHDLPSAPFRLYESGQALRQAIAEGREQFPMVQKARTEGYDGRGVAVLRSEADLPKMLETACVVEDLADIDKELAVIAARNMQGACAAFPAVEMTFHPEANLVEFLLCPARIPPEVAQAAETLALKAIQALDVCGLLAVEMFWTRSGELLINEVAPRPHNSGHHTIDSCYTSQFEQHLRGILGLPLGSTQMKTPSVMLNLLGEPGHNGPAYYQGLEACLALPGVKAHLYGKAETKPHRKMGHVTVLDTDLDTAVERARQVQRMLRVVAR